MIKVGLTGSIAVGKTFVCRIFEELGARVLDADRTARQVVEPGTKGLQRVVQEFGTDILLPTGHLDRAKLGSIVFADENKRQLLNSIIHPLVFAMQDEWLRTIGTADPHATAIVDAALMIESGSYRRFDKLIVVWCGSDIQLKRLMERNSITESEARIRIAAQMPQEEKKRFADFLIDTSSGKNDTRRQTIEIYRHLSDIQN